MWTENTFSIGCDFVFTNPCSEMPKRAAEFFAGIGLMRMGLDAEGWTTVWANDLDEKKWGMYRANFNEGPYEFVLDDVHEVNEKDHPRRRHSISEHSTV